MIQKRVLLFFILVISAVIMGGCEAMDDILPSAGSYKINVNINDVLLDNCSYVTSKDSIHPFFEESVSSDRDITALTVSLRNAKGDYLGSKVIYDFGRNISSETEKDKNDIILTIRNIDDILPSFPIPNDLTPGIYTIVSQVMSGKNILQRTEKVFYYLGSASFSYEGISSYLPNITRSAQLIPTETVVMLEANMDFPAHLNPFIEWYEGRKKISEGYFSDGAGQLFWKSPEQSGFFTISAEVFPVRNYNKLPGYRKEAALVISSIANDAHLVSKNIPQLIHWYTFEGNLNDSKQPVSKERSLIHSVDNKPKWMGSEGTYGVVTGNNHELILPNVSLSNDPVKTWQTFFRFKPLSDGCILSVQFGGAANTYLNLFKEGSVFILNLMSPKNSVSKIYTMPFDLDESIESDASGKQDFFITAGVCFSILPGLLTADINIMEDIINGGSAGFIALETDIYDGFNVLLGYQPETNDAAETASVKAESVALWDEFALYYKPPAETLTAELKTLKNKDQLPDDNTIN